MWKIGDEIYWFVSPFFAWNSSVKSKAEILSFCQLLHFMTLDTSPSPRNANPYLATHPYQPPPPRPSVSLDRPEMSQKTQKIGLPGRLPVNLNAQTRSQGCLLLVKRGPGNEVDPVLHRPPLYKIPKFCQIYYARYLKYSWAGILSFDELTRLISSNRYLVFEVSLI